ncbi:MAG: hypothetical protein KGN79_13750, partial [Acidobacteriota bacterium]|nr:hypothetical protein [Acidobacteriota bacterium]
VPLYGGGRMTRFGTFILAAFTCALTSNLNVVYAQVHHSQGEKAQVEQQEKSKTQNSANQPQDFVLCTGWHALCTSSSDCQMNGDKADCDCMRVDETHIVATAEIQDLPVKLATQAKCTVKHPCNVDQAPICKSIRSGTYEVDNVQYRWVSTYSYRGWCSILAAGIKACNPEAKDYVGDTYWAICDAAPCTEIQNPANPDQPLSCQYRVDTGPFAGMNNSCTGENGGIMSSMPAWAWDFEKNTYPFPMPGYEYAGPACAPLKSDPPPPAQTSADKQKQEP